MYFSETVIVYDIKVGRFSQPNEYMKPFEYLRPRSFIDLGPRSLRFNLFKRLFLRTRGQIEAKFHIEPPLEGGMKMSTNNLCHMTRWPPYPKMVKAFKSLHL